jgi:PAS domain S-box-containing protein
MAETLRLLLLEDNAHDAELIERQLRKAGIAFASERVKTRVAFQRALKKFGPDLILADYSLPNFDALQALAICKKIAPSVPFIIVTGSISEEIAVACMKQGADDYLLKDRLSRLGEAVRHALAGRRLQAEKNKAEESLQASERLHRTFIDSGSDMAFLKDETFRHLLANKELCRFYGKPEKEVLGLTDFELLEATAAAKCLQSDQEALAKNRIHISEEMVGGRTYETRKFQVKLSGGRVGVGGYIRDVTEHRQAQELLLATSRRLELALHSAKAGTWDWNVLTGRIDWSPQMFGLFGLNPRTTMASFASWRSALHPEDREMAENRIALALKKRITLDSDYRVVLPGGGIRWINATGKGIYDEQGHPIQMIGICQDITARKRAEDALRESEERYRDLVENSQDLIFTHNLEGKLLSANKMTARLLGYPIKDLLGMNISDLLIPEVRHLFSPYLTEIRASGRARGHMRIRTAGGANRYWEYDNTLRTKGVPVPFVRGLAHDITERKQAEEALQEMNEIFKLFLKHNPIYVFIKDENIRPVYLSENYEKMLGRPLADILGKNMDELFPSELSRAMIEDDKRILREGKSREFIEELGGRTFSTLKFPISIQGKAKYLAGYTTDITERQQAENALIESEDRYRDLVENSQDLICTHSLEGKLLSVNEAAARFTGYSQQELLHMNMADLLAPKVRRFFKTYLAEIKAKGRAHGIMRIQTAAGETRYWEYDNTLRAKDIATPLVRGLAHDITERKRAEAEILREKSFLEVLVETAPEGIAITDSPGRVLQVNGEFVRMFGYEANEATGKMIDDLVVPPGYQEEAAILTKSSGAGKKVVLETVRKRKDGTFVNVSIIGAPIYIAGKQVGVYAIYRDISERKQAEELVHASLREKEVLLKEIHHRVKNNLQVISGLLTLQAAQIDDERLLRVIKESQSRIWTMALIHQTLYQSGNLADIEMAEYIRTLSGNLLSSHAQLSMPPDIRFDLASLRLAIDKAIPLALIINELLTNAMKHAFPEGRPGEIHITLHECRGTPPCRDKSRRAPTDHGCAPTYELIVADNGAGLPAGFDPKNQKSLGLQLVAMLTQQLGGSFIAANEAGAVFRVSFDAHEKKE